LQDRRLRLVERSVTRTIIGAINAAIAGTVETASAVGGWVAGGGIEQITPTSRSAEYLHYDFEKSRFVFRSPIAAGGRPARTRQDRCERRLNWVLISVRIIPQAVIPAARSAEPGNYTPQMNWWSTSGASSNG
jgi:hypothetical protein